MPPLHSPGMTLPVAPDGSPEVLPDMIPVVPRWQRLASTDQESSDFLPLLLSLIAKEKRSLTAKLHGDDARVTLSVMDEVSSVFAMKIITHVTPSAQVLMNGKIPRGYKPETICTMRMLAYSSGQVPPRYQIDRQSLSVGVRLIARGAFADVREGKLGDKAVAVKTLRVDKTADLYEAQKVCVTSH